MSDAPTVYLAGPVKDVDDPHSWRNAVVDVWDDVFDIENPLDVGSPDQTTIDGESIVRKQQRQLENSDVLLALYPAGDVEIVGTAMESVLGAEMYDCHVVTVWERHSDVGICVDYYSDFVTGSLSHALSYIEDYASDGTVHESYVPIHTTFVDTND